MRHARIALCLAAVLSSSLAQFAEAQTAAQIPEHIVKLDSADPRVRGAAEKSLAAAGLPAIKPLGEIALSGQPQQQFRALRILARSIRSDDEAISVAAAAALRAVAEEGDADNAARAKDELSYFDRLETMRKLAAAFEVRDARAEPNEEAKRVVIPLLMRPLLRFQDRERAALDGTLWAYGEQGRPAAAIAIFPVPAADGQLTWYSDVVSLAAGPLSVTGVDGAAAANWSPASSGEELRTFPDAPPPAKNAKQRLAELHALAGRLAARQNTPAGEMPYDLSLWPKLLHRYSDEQAEILDGGLFAFVHDTNPEVLVLIEAHGKAEAAQWKFALHRHTAAPLHVELDGKEIWGSQAPADFLSGGPNPYWVLRRRIAK